MGYRWWMLCQQDTVTFVTCLICLLKTLEWCMKTTQYRPITEQILPKLSFSYGLTHWWGMVRFSEWSSMGYRWRRPITNPVKHKLLITENRKGNHDPDRQIKTKQMMQGTVQECMNRRVKTKQVKHKLLTTRNRTHNHNSERRNENQWNIDY